ncbi:MAG: hypothetical protein IKN47_04330 [Lachnospiraceae bacterium]|nr:hypothetical protein [Lachnospiraceae bacterium]
MKRILPAFICIIILISLCACQISSDKKMSEEEIESMKAEFAAYLKETYPDETFTIEIWQEYGKRTGAAGLPDYEGYLIRQVITDSKGNRFKVFTSDEGSSIFNIKRVYSDDYQMVLDGRKHYNEKGQSVVLDEDGNVKYVLDP